MNIDDQISFLSSYRIIAPNRICGNDCYTVSLTSNTFDSPQYMIESIVNTLHTVSDVTKKYQDVVHNQHTKLKELYDLQTEYSRVLSELTTLRAEKLKNI